MSCHLLISSANSVILDTGAEDRTFDWLPLRGVYAGDFLQAGPWFLLVFWMEYSGRIIRSTIELIGRMIAEWSVLVIASHILRSMGAEYCAPYFVQNTG